MSVIDYVLHTMQAHELADADRRDIIELCSLAFAEDFSQYFEHHPTGTHVLARDAAGSLLSYGAHVERWLQQGDGPLLRTAYVEALATHPDHRCSGLATAVLERLIDDVLADGTWDVAALSPAVDEFYERRGWEHWRGPLGIRVDGRVEASPPDEEVMILRLPRTPKDLDLDAPLSAEWRVDELW